jgi:preprotein translocase subunit SecD
MTQAKWLASTIFFSGMLIILTACNLSDLFDPQRAVNAPEIPATLQPQAVTTIPDTRATLQAKGCAPDADISLMNKTQQIVQQRLTGLGVSNARVEVQDACHLMIELAAPDNFDQLLDTMRHTGRLELIDAGSDNYPEGTILRTTGNPSPTLAISDTLAAAIPDKVYQAVITGADFLPDELKVIPERDNSPQPLVAFKLEHTAAQKFAEFTTTHNATALNQQYFLCIVLDNVVQSCPIVMSAITTGEGVITVGQGGIDEAQRLLNLLRFGSLPYELEVLHSGPLPAESN